MVQAFTPVESSTIAGMAHNVATSIMTVQFKNGGVYEYENVPREKYEAILGAESVGKAFDRDIKKQAASHPYKKVN